MTQEAAQAVPGCRGLIYLPYLMGERTPHLDPYAKGVFFGLSAMHTRQDMFRAVMEGVAYSLRDCLEIIREMGAEVNEIRASGGGGRSSLWRQMQADNFHNSVSTINSSEGPAFGAALLAGVGAGIYDSVPQACEATIRITGVQQPLESNLAIYDKYYDIYKQLYNDLKATFKKVAEIE
jgi:xylulokinase